MKILKRIRCANPSFGESGPWLVESKEILCAEMAPTFNLWAKESWSRLTDEERDQEEFASFIKAKVLSIEEDFYQALEEVEKQDGK